MTAVLDDFASAPVAAAVFVLADRRGLGADDLAEPVAASVLENAAVRELNPWTGAAASLRAGVVEAARPLRDLITAVVTDPRNAWWSAPHDRDAQLVLTGARRWAIRPGYPYRPALSRRGRRTPSTSSTGVITSTALAVAPHQAIRSGSARATGLRRRRLEPYLSRTPAAPAGPTRRRVYEVNRPADWHALAVGYGDPAAQPCSDRHLREFAGIDNGLAPTWSAVAADYDGVHLTFAGLLTALFVPVCAGFVTTNLWAWEWERTDWIRPAFAAATSLPDLPAAPEVTYPTADRMLPCCNWIGAVLDLSDSSMG